MHLIDIFVDNAQMTLFLQHIRFDRTDLSVILNTQWILPGSTRTSLNKYSLLCIISKFVDALQEAECGRVVVHKLDELKLLIVNLVSDELSAENTPTLPRPSADQLAYIITTSGTTGLPKIVRVPHQCIVPNITHLR